MSGNLSIYLSYGTARSISLKNSSCTISVIPIVMDNVINVCLSGGVEIKGLKANVAPRHPLQQSLPILESYQFVPFIEKRYNFNRYLI